MLARKSYSRYLIDVISLDWVFFECQEFQTTLILNKALDSQTDPTIWMESWLTSLIRWRSLEKFLTAPFLGITTFFVYVVLFIILRIVSEKFLILLLLFLVSPNILYFDMIFGSLDYCRHLVYDLVNSCIRYVNNLRRFGHVSSYGNIVLACDPYMWPWDEKFFILSLELLGLVNHQIYSF